MALPWIAHTRRPLPDLTQALSWIRARPSGVRLVMVNLERSPARLVAKLQHPSACLLADLTRAGAHGSPGQHVAAAKATSMPIMDPLHTVDPCELLHCFDAATDGVCIACVLTFVGSSSSP